MRAVRFHEYGDAAVLQVDDINAPAVADDQVLVRVVTAATNILDIAPREGQMGDAFPGALPSGQGFDLAGTISEIGSKVTGFVVGDDVIGWAPRRAQADYVAVDARKLAHKPGTVSWAAAASIPTAAGTAYGAVHAVNPQQGDTVVVSAAAGGVGALVTQLVINAGATVIATTGPANFDFLRSLGATPVAHGDGLIDCITNAAPDRVTAYLDNYGDGNVDLAVRLGVKPRCRPKQRGPRKARAVVGCRRFGGVRGVSGGAAVGGGHRGQRGGPRPVPGAIGFEPGPKPPLLCSTTSARRSGAIPPTSN
jgi:NADPH:quinone reductase-like Zn-dependent oxidoreductase